MNRLQPVPVVHAVGQTHVRFHSMSSKKTDELRSRRDAIAIVIAKNADALFYVHRRSHAARRSVAFGKQVWIKPGRISECFKSALCDQCPQKLSAFRRSKSRQMPVFA